MITGASSGIGRATALEFARRGTSLVLAARREHALEEVAEECRRLGVAAVAVRTDAADAAAVDALARHAVAAHGRVDVWVNNAGVYLVGRFEDTPPEVFERVVETNFLGYVHGSRAALAQFRRQGSGVLINNASLDAHLGVPYHTAYASSKWAVVGFSHSLRQELRDTPHIDVAVVSPASIDTPLFHQAANYSGRPLKAITPTYEPEKVARAIVALAQRPRREVVVGGAGKLVALQHRIAPALTERVFAAQLEHDQWQDGESPPTPGNAFEPLEGWTGASGGWQSVPRAARRVALVSAAALVPAVGTALWLRR